MIKAVINTSKYFQAPGNYFWRWTENGAVIEWMNGETICYREDLMALLKEISSSGLPPFSSLLLLLSACTHEIKLPRTFFLIRTAKSFNDDFTENLLNEALEFLQLIEQLPAELRTGNRRIHLIYEVFDNTGYVFSQFKLKEALDEFNSGRIDHLVFQEGEAISREQFISDLECFTRAYKKYPDAKTLELKIRSGIDEIPEPIAIEIPESIPTDLLGELEQDPTTTIIAQLTRRLVSVLNVPMHSQGSGDQSYGGISDITNRGNYDKLLLSELANEDALLMARLVNNEALYFRREEPPDNPKRRRTILIDTSLKMWGVPRIFALSAGLAFAQNSHHGEIIEAYALGGEKFTEAELGTKEGIIQLLEVLHHAMHSGKALEAAISNSDLTDENEFILITEAKLLHDAAFQQHLQQVKEDLSFIITVSRTGELEFFECIKGKARLLNTAKLDLHELMFAKIPIGPPAMQRAPSHNDAPAFFDCFPCPILYPKIRIKNQEHKQLLLGNNRAVFISETQRLLYITSADRGAYELIDSVEKGIYTFGWDGISEVYLLVNNYQRKLLKLYKIDIVLLTVRVFNVSDQIINAREAVFANKRFYLRSQYDSFVLDAETAAVLDKTNGQVFNIEFNMAKNTTISPEQTKQIDDLLRSNIGFYNGMFKVKKLFVSRQGKLVIGNYHLDLTSNTHRIRFVENLEQFASGHHSKETNNQLKLLPNKSIKFSVRKWEDGSEAIIDSRGLLHLKSSLKSIPEITIVLVTGVGTTCWSADGFSCGESFFINEGQSTTIHTAAFYKRFIQPFIDHVLKP